LKKTSESPLNVWSAESRRMLAAKVKSHREKVQGGMERPEKKTPLNIIMKGEFWGEREKIKKKGKVG